MRTTCLLLAVTLGLALSARTAAQTQGQPPPVVPGPFTGTLASLTNYHVPDWFRDAKFGIWAHWGPQAVPMNGDWYARGMYEEGSGHYKHHLANYGHPSTNGYKDIIPLWKAEKWDPDRLMALYKKAGARYFVSMGTHHDNFHLWNSQLHEWNAVNMGPKRDVVGDWQKAAQRQGLRFGVSEHLGASFTWWQASHGADKAGPFAGVPYDGANPAFADLYHFPADPGDKAWYSNNPRWQRMWYGYLRDLVDHYPFDLLYTDGGVPFGNEIGLSLIADFYNTSVRRHGGKLEAVYTCKQKSDGRWVEDLERGVMPGINPYPWQTDTSIGDWYYNKNWKFRPVDWTIHMLVDIVSKNGNLLLNVVQRPDGSLDPEVLQALEELAAWVKIHGEAIHGTRPWLIYGEGAVKAKGGHFKEDFAYSARDIRFTTKGRTLFATALGWPADNQLVIRSLAKPADGHGNRIRRVELLGYRGKLKFRQTAESLVVTLPAEKVSPYTATLKIAGDDLQPVGVTEVAAAVMADPTGNLTLTADLAETHGSKLGVESRAGVPNLGFWDDAAEYATWLADLPAAGNYTVTAMIACPQGTPAIAVELPGGKLTGPVAQTKGWDDFQAVTLGKLKLSPAGSIIVKIAPADTATWKPINLRWIKLTRAD